jgi:hypothetical protein
LFEVVEPLERQLNANYNRAQFKTLRRLVSPKRRRFFLRGADGE